MLIQELEELQTILRKDLGNSVSLRGVFNASVLNSLWFIVTGKRFELTDPKLKELINLLISNVQGNIVFSPGMFFFTPVKYGLYGRKHFQSILKFLKKVKTLIGEVIDEHLETYVDGEIRDFVDAYIKPMKETSQTESSFYSEEGRNNLVTLLLDLFVAGAETTSTTMQWAILYLGHYPEVQRKVQVEIDRIIGKSRVPSRDDRPKMVYFEAVLQEIHRQATLVPFVHHKASHDSEIDGHFIPKDSVVSFSLYHSHQDKDLWGDPENFRPERFLDESGTKVLKNEALMPFASGKRQCLGETLARDTLFLFLAGLLQQFNFELDPSSDANDKHNLRNPPSLITSPKSFNVIINERN